MNHHTFEHNGKSYEIRITSDGNSVLARVFTGGKPVNGLQYRVTIRTIDDAATVADLDVVKELIKTAQFDITKT